MLLCLVIIPCRSLACGFLKLGKLGFPQEHCHCFAFLVHCLTVWAASLRPTVVAPILGKIIGGPSQFGLDWNSGILRGMSWEVTGPEDPMVSLLPWLQADCQSVGSLSYCSIDTESSFLNPTIFRRYFNRLDLDLERYRSCDAVQHAYGSENPQMTNTKQSLTEWSVMKLTSYSSSFLFCFALNDARRDKCSVSRYGFSIICS